MKIIFHSLPTIKEAKKIRLSVNKQWLYKGRGFYRTRLAGTVRRQQTSLFTGYGIQLLGMSGPEGCRVLILDILYKCRPECPIPRQIPFGRPFSGKVQRPCRGPEFADF